MGQKVLITESQYSRIFLNEGYVNPECLKRFDCENHSGCWKHETHAPYWYTLKEPFGDGFDYQWRYFDDCSRKWIRRNKRHRDKGKDFLGQYTDMTWGNDAGGGQMYLDRYNSSFHDQEGKEILNKLSKEIRKSAAEYKKRQDGYATLESKKEIVGDTNRGLVALGFKDVNLSDDELKLHKWDKIPQLMFNIRGYELIKKIEDIKDRYGVQWWGCRGIYFDDLGKGSGNAVDAQKIKTINPNYILDNYVKPRKWLRAADGMYGSGLSTYVNKYPWMGYFHMDGFPGKYNKSNSIYPGTNISAVQPTVTDKLLGDDVNWINWLSIVYQNPDFRTLESEITKIYKNRDYTNKLNKIICDVSKREAAADRARRNGGEDDSFSWTYHDSLDVIAAILFFIPGGQPLSLGIEILNATAYALEGDVMGGALGLAFTLLPMGGPLFRRLGKVGTKKVNRVIINTNDFIKVNPKATKKQIQEFIEQEAQILSKAEREALTDGLSKQNMKVIKKEYGELAKKSRSEQKKYLLNKTRNDNYKNYLHGWGNNSKYWERQIHASVKERVIVPLIILGSVWWSKSKEIEAKKALNDAGYKNITEKDVPSIIDDVNIITGGLDTFNEDKFLETLNKNPEDIIDSSTISQLYDYFSIIDSTGTDSKFYKDTVKPNISDPDLLYKINKSIEDNPKIKDLDLRDLKDSVDEKWYEFLNCEKDPYSENPVKISNEKNILEKSFQDKITEKGEPLFLKNDTKYMYSLYGGLWYYKERLLNSMWKPIKTCLACSKLQKQYNTEIENFLIDSDFEFELEVLKNL